ncbi:hypothetical protein IFM89_015520 [Coptis chinensis]|uniref:Protein N-terminal glutamine amidohydrolase alpha beta roll domain-containing protein n=1 Tax=Coptis chinensis TaxID=261450 RepID=A0A835J0H0_9MAGN|nr:hypothetical protein IFM89_015520 [Coptis chinensis]
MATSKLEFPPVTTSSPLNISDFDHTPSYCEENVYMLCKKLSEIGVSKNDGFDLFVAFISNDHKQVTFRDPEVAKRACLDPSPVIDGRRANCNLASLGRPRPPSPYGHLRAMTPYFASGQSSRPYIGSPSYHQPVTYNYQQGFAHPQYG